MPAIVNKLAYSYGGINMGANNSVSIISEAVTDLTSSQCCYCDIDGDTNKRVYLAPSICFGLGLAALLNENTPFSCWQNTDSNGSKILNCYTNYKYFIQLLTNSQILASIVATPNLANYLATGTINDIGIWQVLFQAGTGAISQATVLKPFGSGLGLYTNFYYAKTQNYITIDNANCPCFYGVSDGSYPMTDTNSGILFRMKLK